MHFPEVFDTNKTITHTQKAQLDTDCKTLLNGTRLMFVYTNNFQFEAGPQWAATIYLYFWLIEDLCKCLIGP